MVPEAPWLGCLAGGWGCHCFSTTSPSAVPADSTGHHAHCQDSILVLGAR